MIMVQDIPSILNHIHLNNYGLNEGSSFLHRLTCMLVRGT